MAPSKYDREFQKRLHDLPTRAEWGEFFTYGFDGGDPVHVRDRALLMLMYRSGLRVGEACALGVDDLDMGTAGIGAVHVPDVPTMTKMGSRTTYFDATDTDLQNAITAWLVVRALWNPATSRLFVTRSGEPFTRERTTLLRQRVKKAAIRAWNNGGLTPSGRRVHTHALRHSFTTDLANNGAAVTVLQAALGHRSSAMTMRYVHADPREVHDYMAREIAKNDAL